MRNNTIAVHCKNGKNRSGTMICALLAFYGPPFLHRYVELKDNKQFVNDENFESPSYYYSSYQINKDFELKKYLYRENLSILNVILHTTKIHSTLLAINLYNLSYN